MKLTPLLLSSHIQNFLHQTQFQKILLLQFFSRCVGRCTFLNILLPKPLLFAPFKLDIISDRRGSRHHHKQVQTHLYLGNTPKSTFSDTLSSQENITSSAVDTAFSQRFSMSYYNTIGHQCSRAFYRNPSLLSFDSHFLKLS